MLKLIKGCLIFIGVITLLFIISLCFGYYLLSLPPPIKNQMVPVVLTPEAAQSLDQKLERFKTEIKNAAATGQEKEVSLIITEEEINSKLAEVIGEGKLPFTDILINFQKNNCLVYGALKTPGLSVKIGAETHAEIKDGKLKVTIDKFYCGKLPLPQKLRNIASKPLASLIDPTRELPWQITKIQITENNLIITGMTKKG